MSVAEVWAAQGGSSYGGMLENSFEHSETRIDPIGRCPKVQKSLDICKKK